MQALSWKAKRNEICKLIKKISDHYGGDDRQWLKEYAQEVINSNRHDLTKALECFLDLERQLEIMPRFPKQD